MQQNKEDLQNQTVDGTPIDDKHWQSLLARQTQQYGFEIYAVKTTKIYCKFGCSARTPNRENVLIFKNSKNAIDAGYRACKRCKP